MAISVRGGELAMTLEEKLIERGELNGKIETAKILKDKGTDFEFISEIAGLSMEEFIRL